MNIKLSNQRIGRLVGRLKPVYMQGTVLQYVGLIGSFPVVSGIAGKFIGRGELQIWKQYSFYSLLSFPFRIIGGKTCGMLDAPPPPSYAPITTQVCCLFINVHDLVLFHIMFMKNRYYRWP